MSDTGFPFFKYAETREENLAKKIYWYEHRNDLRFRINQLLLSIDDMITPQATNKELGHLQHIKKELISIKEDCS